MSLIERKITQELNKIENTLKISYSDKFLSIVNLFCSANPHVEWSGVLFYRIDKTENNNIDITLVDIQLMDIGSSVFTQYSFDGSIGELGLKYLFSDENNYHMGHIHSHNKMPVFFSGTDNQELIDNSDQHFMYLSVIVNNNLDIKARAIIKEEVTYSIQASGSILFKDATKSIRYPKKIENGIKLWYYEAEFNYLDLNSVFTTEENSVFTIDELGFYLKSLKEVNEKTAINRTANKNIKYYKDYEKPVKGHKNNIKSSTDYELVKELLTEATNLVGKNKNNVTSNISASIAAEIPVANLVKRSITSLIDLLNFNGVENMIDCLNTAKHVITNTLHVYPKIQDRFYIEINNQIEDQNCNINTVINGLLNPPHDNTHEETTDFWNL